MIEDWTKKEFGISGSWKEKRVAIFIYACKIWLIHTKSISYILFSLLYTFKYSRSYAASLVLNQLKENIAEKFPQ